VNLIFDQGNTRTKTALFDKGHLVKSAVFDQPTMEDFISWIDGVAVSKAIVASVVGQELYQNLLQTFSFPVMELTHKSKLPFINKYATPNTLGLDRMALVAGAMAEYPAANCLVIDAGTCITYDFLTHKGHYLGGAIAPGIQMRLRAMNHFTARLPLGKVSDFDGFIGKTTLQSLSAGAVQGAINEVAGTINTYQHRFAEVTTLLTGGDLGLFDGLLKNSIFAAPELLLRGLNNILDQNAEVP
jgi:type III pantothenate kinase